MAQDLHFDEDDLRALAGPRTFERCQGYLAAVTAMEVGDGWITGHGPRDGRLPDGAEARRSLAAYQQLRMAARAAGCWQAEREQALVLLRADAGQRQQCWYGGPVLLDDGDVDAAWRAAAETRAQGGSGGGRRRTEPGPR
ncbi:hypothetical protein ACFOZ0_04875 [Streptomyces yaanensis]|uniref:Uncharacterized protein n=1 Tax=Streptomyces yaanensis TaxID=1142239 RepID=A0ABV7S843_9ACTN